jgi:hypothetical protein
MTTRSPSPDSWERGSAERAGMPIKQRRSNGLRYFRSVGGQFLQSAQASWGE